jgi:MerR family transcriptional regulator, copper efflux regulator
MEVSMSAEAPIACSLNASELPARHARMAALGRDALLASRAGATHAELRFAARAGVRARLEDLAAAEARCCPFLDMAIADEGDAVVLAIDAPEAAAPVLAELVGAFGGGA